MGSGRNTSSPDSQPVTVFTGDGESVPQPKTFQFCPLGAQIYTRTRMDECSMLELELEIPDGEAGSEPLSCTGIVANCRPASHAGMYRVWIKFLDLPESARERIHCVAKSSEFLCPFCANY